VIGYSSASSLGVLFDPETLHDEQSASELSISERTIENHIGKILKGKGRGVVASPYSSSFPS
jgi:hypothetical protein